MDLNSNLQLNIIVPIVLVVMLAILLIHSIVDKLWSVRAHYKNYILWLIGVIVYIVLFTVCYYINYSNGPALLYKILYSAFMFVGSLNYAFRFLWVVGMIRDKYELKLGIVIAYLIVYLIIGLLPIHYIIHDCIPTNMAYDNYNNYLSLQIFNIGLIVMTLITCVIIISCAKYIGKFDFFLLIITILLPNCIQFQKIWVLVPTLIIISLLMMVIYLRQWQDRKNEMVSEKLQLAEMNQEIAEKEQLLSETRMDLMLSQIQPHFLYNSLNSIASLCGTNPEKAREITISFADYLRMQLDSMKENTPVPFNVELEHTQIYVNIEKVRFGKRLVVNYDIQTEDFTIPPLTVQPIVENAIKHGVNQRRMGGVVTIRSVAKDDGYYIYIIDDGVGFDQNAEPKKDGKTHVGLSAVKQRLAVKSNGTITINSVVGEGTTVTIFIPKEAATC